jgi:hypothetical protein
VGSDETVRPDGAAGSAGNGSAGNGAAGSTGNGAAGDAMGGAVDGVRGRDKPELN